MVVCRTGLWVGRLVPILSEGRSGIKVVEVRSEWGRVKVNDHS